MNTDAENKNSTTPIKRLTWAFIIGEIGVYIAMLTPGTILLTLKVNEISPENAISAFSTIGVLAGIIALISMPLGGYISDRIRLNFGKRKTVIVAGILVGVISLICMGLSNSLIILGIFACLLSFGTNVAQAGYAGLLVDQVDDTKRGTMSGILGVMGMAGLLIGMGIMTLMAQSSNFEKYAVISLVSLITTIVACILIKDSPSDRTQPEETDGNKVPLTARLSKIYPSPRKYPVFSWGVLSRLLVSLAVMSVTFNSMMLMQRYNYTEDVTTQLTAIISFASLPATMIATLLGGMLSDKLRKQKIFIIVSPIIVSAALIILAFAPNFTAVLVANIILQFGYGIYTGVSLAVIARILPNKQDAAKDMGIMNMSLSLPQTIVPMIAPLLLSIGSWPFYFIFLAVMGILSIFASLPIPDLPKKKNDENNVHTLETKAN